MDWLVAKERVCDDHLFLGTEVEEGNTGTIAGSGVGPRAEYRLKPLATGAGMCIKISNNQQHIMTRNCADFIGEMIPEAILFSDAKAAVRSVDAEKCEAEMPGDKPGPNYAVRDWFPVDQRVVGLARQH
jgi:hypothetical protein